MNRRLRDAVREVLEHVEPGDTLFGEQRGGPCLRLLQNGRNQVADLRLLPLRALHVQHRGLQRAPERRCLFGFALASARKGFDRLVKAVADVASQQREVRAARAENTLPVGIVRNRIQEVFEREIGVAARHGFPERDVEHDFDGGREHQASSMIARNGKPASAASTATLSAFVSATSHV